MLFRIALHHVCKSLPHLQHSLLGGVVGFQEFRLKGDHKPTKACLYIDDQAHVFGSGGLHVIDPIQAVFIMGEGLNAIIGDEAEHSQAKNGNHRDEEKFFPDRKVVKSFKNTHG